MADRQRSKITSKQQQMIDHINNAKSKGQTISAYATSHGLSKKELYNYHWLLRKKGLLQDDEKPFVRIVPEIQNTPLDTTITICFANGIQVQVNTDHASLGKLLQQVQSL